MGRGTAALANGAWRAEWRAERRARLTPAAILGALPPPALILAGIVSVQVGAGLAKQLFAVVPPASVTLLRLWSSAILMLVPTARYLWRRRPQGAGNELAQRRVGWRSLGIVVAFGLTLAVMNFAIYQSFARIPLGVAVTIEFLGPLAVAVAASRRLVDLAWVALAGAGVALLTRGGGHITVTGVAFALVAAAGWATYILVSAATGRRFPGSTGLTIAMVIAAVAITPVGVTAGAALLRPGVLAIGAGIGLLSSVIPYSLELEALRRVPPRVFGVLMSLEPAVAALVGLFLLGQVLAPREWIAIGFVMLACIGAARGWSGRGLDA